MKLLVYSHSLQIAGSQLVAVNLAGAMRERGHDVLLAGPPGPLTEVAAGKGLRVVPIPRRSDRRPSLESAIALRRVIRREQVDLVHAYSHSACIEAFFAGYVSEGLPLICSERGRTAPRPFPKSLPMIVAQAYVGEDAVRLGQRHVYLMRPVVDTDANSPGADVPDLRAQLGVSDDAANLVIVSRLGMSVKLEGIRRAIEAAAILSEQMPIRLLIAGDGPARGQLTEQAEIVNSRLGRPVVIFAGEMLDPRPAYAAADVVLGMQGAILRGMAFAKPAIVLGERGFSEVVTPDTVERFLQDQFYRKGDGDLSPGRLVSQIAGLLSDAKLREQLGNFGREIVCEHVSLLSAADLLEQIYATHGNAPTRLQRLEEGLRLSGAIARRKLARNHHNHRRVLDPVKSALESGSSAS
jgi:glycosyltransferase involved in cell wall biosynthesis